MKLFLKHKNNDSADRSADKIFVKNILVMIMCTLLCIAALSGATWAWFGTNVCSGSQRLELAYCEVDVSVFEKTENITINGEGETVVTYDSIELVGSPDGEKTIFNLSPNTTYSIVISSDGTAENCYARVFIAGNKYNTERFSVSSDLSFELTLAGDSLTEFYVLPGFGIPSGTLTFYNGGAYDSDSIGLASTIAESEEESESEPESATEPVTEGESETEIKAETEIAPETEEPESEPESEPETETEAPETEEVTEPETEAVTEEVTELVTEAVTEEVTEPAAETEQTIA